MLKINKLNAKIDSKEILKEFSLNINPGEVHAIMGPNGSGKSTLSNILSGKKGYEVSGDVLFENKLFKNILLNYHCMSQFCNKLNEMYFNKTFSYRGDYILDLQKTRQGQILLSKLNIKIAVSNYSGF